MVMPTVFIGIGTSGTEIIQGVRRLLYEEYGKPGLPCIRFVSMETLTNQPSSAMEVYVRDEDKAWQRLQILPLSVTWERLKQLRNKLDPGNPEYHPGWAEWIDPSVTAGAAFTTGAKGWRMAGRFCLWANWNAVYSGLIEAFQSVIQGRDESIALLEKHYDAKGAARPEGDIVEPALRIYICGSLCGGTCSGTMWEVGFMAQEALADAAVGFDPDIHGIFTVVDRKTANSKKKSDVVCSMNCWASLLEYDFWASGDHPYQISHPADANSLFPNVPNDFGPFQCFSIVSTSNDSGFQPAAWSGQEYDLAPLHASISTSLYLDLVKEVRAQKDGDRAQYEITEEIGKKSPNGLYCQRIQSFGLSGFYYPKFAIASAAACQLAKELVEQWTADGNKNRAQQFAHDDWNEIYQTIRVQLLQISGMNFLEYMQERLRTELEPFESEPLPALLYHLKNKTTIPILPGKPLLAEALQPKEAVYRHFHQEAHRLSNLLIAEIQKRTERRINDIRTGGCTNMDEAVKYLEELPKRMQETIAGLPVETDLKLFAIPWPSLKNLSLRFKEIGQDWWLKITFSCKPIQKYYLQKAMQDITVKVQETIERIADAVMRRICEEAMKTLSGEIAAGEFQSSSIYDNVREQLNRLKNRVAPALNRRWEDMTKEWASGSLRMVSARDSIAKDAEALVNAVKNRLRNSDVYPNLLTDGEQSIGFYHFLRMEPEEIEQKLLKFYQPECWRAAESVNIIRQLNTDRFSKQAILELARGSIPWLQFAGGAVPNKGCDEPDIIIGPKGSDARLQEIATSLRTLDEKMPFFRPVTGILDNMVVFYDEAAALSLEDWQLEPILDNLLKHGGRTEAKESAPSPYNNHYTHKLGALRYHPKLRKLIDDLRFWIEAVELFAEHLLSLDFLRVDAEANTIYYLYVTRFGARDKIDLRSKIEIAQFAAVDDGEAALQFIERIMSALDDLGFENVRDIANEIWEQEEDRNKQKRIKEIAERLIQELFMEEMRRQK
ncbi:MAG: tubulin-like doman-containing protein [Candidatus Omnitrophota bacterium]